MASQRKVSGRDPGVAFVVTAPQTKAGAKMLKVFDPFIGEWVGTRTLEDGTVVTSKRRFTPYLGGPQVLCVVEDATNGKVSATRAMAYFYSPQRRTLLTYFFESEGNVQLFELDHKASNTNQLVWQEILRPGAQFRVIETVPKAGAFTVTVLRQDARGRYVHFAFSQHTHKP